MDTEVLAIDSEQALDRARRLLQDESVIAGPTDTVYGVMGRYDSPRAIDEIYRVKDRPPQKPLPVLLSDLAQLEPITPLPLPHLATLLADRFWPGALTIVLPARPGLPFALTSGQPTVAVRIPAHDAFRQLMRMTGPLAVTSANRSGQPDARSATEVLAQLGGRIPLILDGGLSPDNVPSTIVDLSGTADERPRLLRLGSLAAQVEALLKKADASCGSDISC